MDGLILIVCYFNAKALHVTITINIRFAYVKQSSLENIGKFSPTLNPCARGARTEASYRIVSVCGLDSGCVAAHAKRHVHAVHSLG